MITVGTMQLHQPQAPDSMEPFFVGGEYHTDMARLSAHDHSGGLLGAPVAVTIPDGSITTADLDPSVLAPYALTDGSKPFTGQVTLQADAVVRDALLFGQQGSALAPDATLARTGAGVLDLGGRFEVSGAGAALRLQDGVLAGRYFQLFAQNDHLYVNRNEGTRVDLTPNGTLTLTPSGGQYALVAEGGAVVAQGVANALQVTPAGANGPLLVDQHSGSPLLVTTGPTNLALAPAAGIVYPSTDNAVALGAGHVRYTAVYAVGGVITTSSQHAKAGVTPLDPGRAMQAVRDTEAVTFDYLAPTRGPEWYDLPDDPEQAEQVLQQRLTAAPLEAAARHQHGFVAEDCDPLFLVGEGQTSPGSSIGVLLAALQNMDSRLAALEGTP